MSEATQRRKVVLHLKQLHGVAVENPAYPGTPDVNYVEGWVELKWLRRWPARGGVVRIEHFTPQQRYWLRKRCEKGGRAWLLLQVKREWLLFRGDVAAEHVGKVDAERLRELAEAHWPNGLNGEELRCKLTS